MCLNGVSTWWAKKKDVLATKSSQKKETNLQVSSVSDHFMWIGVWLFVIGWSVACICAQT
jgi:hypothetical protein